MLQKYPFSEQEMKVVEEIPGMFGMVSKLRNSPITPRQNTEAMYFEKKPCWMPTQEDYSMMFSGDMIYVNTLGRGRRKDITDAFGIPWVYVPTAMGSIVKPGEPLLTDIENWRDVIKMPDIEKFDWEAQMADAPVDMRFACDMTFVNGFWFERLISFMDFMYAAIAIIDEDQVDYVKEIFEETTELGCKCVDKFCQCFPQIDGFTVHDDWGSQKDPFFSEEIAYELFIPYMKRFSDCVHEHGRYLNLHSCGHNEKRVQCFIDAGFDSWEPQLMNDIKKLYEEYGDKIILAVWPDRDDIAELSEEEQRAEARKFADFYCKPGKPAMLGLNGQRMTTPAFRDELYKYSRQLYLAMD